VYAIFNSNVMKPMNILIRSIITLVPCCLFDIEIITYILSIRKNIINRMRFAPEARLVLEVVPCGN